MKTEPNDFKLTITTLFGLEEILEAEVRKIGGREVTRLNRAVQCVGDLGFIYKCNLLLRTAIKVLRPIQRIRFRDDDSFYKAFTKIDWPAFFALDKSFAIEVTGQSHTFRNSLYAARKAKDAIVDVFREKHDGKRPNVSPTNPQVKINIHLNNHEAEVYLNSSGDSLHKRGYRVAQGPAHLSEVLAAGIIQMSGWNGGKPFFDPMCGSGTFLIEGALIASKLPAGVFRKDFGFAHWLDYDEELFNTIRESTLNKSIEYEGRIIGRDKMESSLDAAAENIAETMLDDLITLRKADFLNDDPPTKTGIMFINPPYNKKVRSENNNLLYEQIGNKLKHAYPGWEVYIITGDLEAAKHIGLKPTWRKKLFNGPLESHLLKFELFAGKRKDRLKS